MRGRVPKDHSLQQAWYGSLHAACWDRARVGGARRGDRSDRSDTECELQNYQQDFHDSLFLSFGLVGVLSCSLVEREFDEAILVEGTAHLVDP